MALDLIGVYLKNYEIDKQLGSMTVMMFSGMDLDWGSDTGATMSLSEWCPCRRLSFGTCFPPTVLPRARKRGGTWLIKALDKLCAVRMKQFRAYDALVALKEIEQNVPFQPEEGWEVGTSTQKRIFT